MIFFFFFFFFFCISNELTYIVQLRITLSTNIPAAIRCQNVDVSTSMRRNHVASTLIWRHFRTKCPLGYTSTPSFKPSRKELEIVHTHGPVILKSVFRFEIDDCCLVTFYPLQSYFGIAVSQWAKHWPVKLAVSGSIPVKVKFFLSHTGSISTVISIRNLPTRD